MGGPSGRWWRAGMVAAVLVAGLALLVVRAPDVAGQVITTPTASATPHVSGTATTGPVSRQIGGSAGGSVRLTFRVHSSLVRRTAASVAYLGVSPEASVGAPQTTSYAPGHVGRNRHGTVRGPQHSSLHYRYRH